MLSKYKREIGTENPYFIITTTRGELIEIDLENNRDRRQKKSSHWFKSLSESGVLSLTLDDQEK
jgi:CO dehydrogenase/acetyl-CoA synthase beta subunit